MWTAISVLTFFALWWFLRRLQLRAGSWKAETAATGGIPYLLSAPRRKGKVVGVLIGIEGSWGWGFTLRPEKWYDRSAKLLGIGVEFQTGHGEFDETYFIVSDDPATGRGLTRSAAFRATALRIVELGARHDVRITGVHFSRQRVWIHLAPAGKKGEIDVERLATDFVLALRDAAEQLAREGVTSSEEPAAGSAALLHSCAAALLANGVIHTVRLRFDTAVMDTGRLLMLGLSLGAVLAVLLAVLTLVTLAGSSRRHTKLAVVLLVGFAGGSLSGFLLLRDVNREFDLGKPRRIAVALQGKRERHRRKRGMVRELFVADWRGERQQRALEVTKATYDAAAGWVAIYERPGLLGAWWVGSIGIPAIDPLTGLIPPPYELLLRFGPHRDALLAHLMKGGSKEAAGFLVDLAKEQGMVCVRLFGQGGKVAFSTMAGEIGGAPMNPTALEAMKARKPGYAPLVRVRDTVAQQLVLPLLNKEGCAGCHRAWREQYLGALEILFEQ